jgi:hypothetical protein
MRINAFGIHDPSKKIGHGYDLASGVMDKSGD